jgi:hypothetical protein
MLVKVRDLKQGDLVDMEKSIFPFDYPDSLAAFEYGKVQEIQEETPDCFLLVFENLPSVAISPKHNVWVEK